MNTARAMSRVNGQLAMATLCIWLLLPLSAVVYQVAAKKVSSCGIGETGVADWIGCVLHARWFGVMVVADIVGFVAWMFVLGRMKLSAAFPMSALSYVLVITASWLVFREPATVKQIIGSALIMAGVFLLGRNEGSPS